MPDKLLRLAVPNKGSLSQAATDMLREAGYKQRTDAKRLTLTDGDNGVEFFYLRPRDIAVYVGEGTLDVGITGRDLLLDSRRQGRGGAAARLRPLAVPLRRPARHGVRRRRPRRQADRDVVRRRGAPGTSSEHGVEATVTRLDGAVETSVQLGVADVIADVVETGSTLRNAGLEVFGEPILESEAVLITRAGVDAPAGLRRCSGAGSRASWSRGPT